MRHGLGAALTVAFWRLFLACDKGDAPSGAPADPAATVTASPSSDPDAAAIPPGLPGDAGRIPPGSPGRLDGGPSASEAPLLFWMQDHTAAALRRGDSAALATDLDEVATFAPKEPAYANWASIARDGADAARAGSLDGVKAACRGCHAQYRAAYKAAMRARPLPSPPG